MSKLTEAARGQPCMVRIPNVCNFNAQTTVLAHVRLAGTCGVGMKSPDLLGSWACSNCHDLIDGRASGAFTKTYTRDQVKLMHLEGMARTINELIKQGKL
jgi:hypothetical protein